jgi:hypothetical protein
VHAAAPASASLPAEGTAMEMSNPRQYTQPCRYIHPGDPATCLLGGWSVGLFIITDVNYNGLRSGPPGLPDPRGCWFIVNDNHVRHAVNCTMRSESCCCSRCREDGAILIAEFDTG